MTKTKLITAMLFLALAIPGFAKIPITGTIRQANGSMFNGSVTLTLSQPAKTISTNEMVLSVPYKYMIVNGALPPAASITPNDDLLPRTYYWATFRDMTGKIVKVAPYFVTGLSFDIGAAIPTTITTNNISIQDLLGIRSIGVTGNITADGSITAGAGFYGDLHGNVFGNVTSTGTSTFNIINATTVNATTFNGAFNGNGSGTWVGLLQLNPHVGLRKVETDANGFLIESSSPTAFVAASSGYTWAGGVLLQWKTGGCLTGAQDATTFTATFPITFPNGVFQVQITGKDDGADLGEIVAFSVTSWTTSGVSYHYARNADHGGATTCPQIFAVGY